jgi:hypothetical protein
MSSYSAERKEAILSKLLPPIVSRLDQ